jgi:hypothetical protein
MSQSHSRYSWSTALVCALALSAALCAVGPVAQAAPAVAKDITFFLHYVNANETSKTLPGAGSTWNYFDTTTEWESVNVTAQANGSLQNFFWYLAPPLAGQVTVSDFSLAVWAQFLSGTPNAQTTVALYERNDTGAENQVASVNFGSQSYSVTPALKQLNGTLPGSHTFASGSSIKVVLTLNPGAGSMELIFDTARADSRVVLHTDDAIAVSSIAVLDSAGVAVSSLDPRAANATATLRATVSDPYGGYDVASAKLTLLDPEGGVLLDNASMPRVSGTPISLETVFELPWNYSDRAPGEYHAFVYAMDNNGVNWFTHFAQFSYGPYGDVVDRSFFIGSLPLYAWVRLVDDHAVPLENADLRVESAGSRVASGSTDAAGLANLTLFAGNYTLKASWHGVEVASVPFNLSDNISQGSAFEVVAAVYYPTLKVVDSHGSAVEYAFVYLSFANGTSTVVPYRTDADGSVSLMQVTGGPLGVRVLWRGVEVAATTFSVSSSTELRVQAAVYYLTVQVNDGAGAPLALALVRMDDAVFGLLSVANVTGSNGRFVERLPVGTYDLSVTWRGVAVGSANDQPLSADSTATISASVFALTVKTTAGDGSPVAGATVTVSTASGQLFEVGVTGADGSVRFQAPSATYSVSAHFVTTSYWTPVEETQTAGNVTLDQAKTVELKFTQAPGGFVGSNQFIALIAIAFLAFLLVLSLIRKGKQAKETPPAEPSKTPPK